MVETWFFILCVTLIGYAVFDGWNIGCGVVQFLVTKSQAERRLVIAAIGPLWTWHEVWLVATGGVLFVAFPAVLAVVLPGFYLAVFVLIWCLVGRGIALEFGGHVDDPLWRTFWDAAFAIVNVLIAVLLGAALGNLVRGVPLGPSRKFSLALFTDFRTLGHVGILDWYTISIAAFTLICVGAHGATYLTWRSEGVVRERSLALSRRLWITVLALLPMITFDTWMVRPQLFKEMMVRPAAWIMVAAVVVGSAMLIAGSRRENDGMTFIGGCAVITGLLGAAAASVFPVMLYSTLDPVHSLTAQQGAVGGAGLALALVWWPVAFALSLGYGLFIFRQFKTLFG